MNLDQFGQKSGQFSDFNSNVNSIPVWKYTGNFGPKFCQSETESETAVKNSSQNNLCIN